MPRRKDPVADLHAHRQRVADLNAKEEALLGEAAKSLGLEMIEAGLDQWSAKDRALGLKRLAAEGPQRSVKQTAKAETNGAAMAGSETPPAGGQS